MKRNEDIITPIANPRSLFRYRVVVSFDTYDLRSTPSTILTNVVDEIAVYVDARDEVAAVEMAAAYVKDSLRLTSNSVKSVNAYKHGEVK